VCIYHQLALQAKSNPEALALLAPGRKPITYSRLLIQVEETIAVLNAIGIGRGDRVAVALADGPEMVATFLSVAGGATCAPLNPSYRATEFDFLLSDLNPKALIVEAQKDSPAVAVAESQGIPVIELLPSADGEAGIFSLKNSLPLGGGGPNFAEPGDTALVLHTSGTTSRPKIVPLTHANLCHSAHNIRGTLNLSPVDRCLNVMPLFHVHGLIGATLSSMVAGASVVCTPGFHVGRFFEWLEEFRPTWYTAAPAVHQAILARAERDPDLITGSSLRFIRSSSSGLLPQLMVKLEQAFQVPLVESYGMTEASHQVASNPLPPGKRKAGSVGLPAGSQIAIMDPQGELLELGREGEIVIRGDSVSVAHQTTPPPDNWFRTGDQGLLDSDGYLFITGRIKEIINRGGEKISPREVEDVLLTHPAVAEAVAFALPDPWLGEDVGAAVVLRENASVAETDICEFVADRLADFKAPRRVMVLDEIVKGPTGKPQRIGLASKLGLAGSGRRQGQASAAIEMSPMEHRVEKTTPRMAGEDQPDGAEPDETSAKPRTPMQCLIAEIWQEVLGLEQVGLRDNFFDLGVNSMLAMKAIGKLERNTGLHVDPREFVVQSLGQLATMYQERTFSCSAAEPESWVKKLYDAVHHAVFQQKAE
jgi:acyl-CoA synthetase (AMP-forming)/AMP-acid ligase II